MDAVIYLDNNATTRPAPEVVQAMLPYLRDQYANPSSVHRFGQEVRNAVETAREQVAAMLHASPREMVFTSGGTESVNLAVSGVLAASPAKRRLVTSAVEHSAVRRLADQLEREGHEVVRVGVDGQGRLDSDQLSDALTEDTALASLMWANNETGVLFDVEKIAGLAADRGVPLHLDAVQAAGKVPIDVGALPVSLMSISGHKFHGPKGAGALFVRRRTRLRPMQFGGSQEHTLRAGTENVPAIVGLGVAAELAAARSVEESDRIGKLRDRLESGILEQFCDATVHGAGAPRLANTTNIGFAGLEAEAVLIVLSEAGIWASSGSACSSGSLEPSHVLKAMQVDPRSAHGAIRFSLSHDSTEEEIGSVVRELPKLLSRLAALAPQ